MGQLLIEHGFHRIVGWVNVPDSQATETPRGIKIFAARPDGINLPTRRVLDGTRQIKNLLNTSCTNDLCLTAISGGGSALLEDPVPDIELRHLIQTTKFLSARGSDIHRLNLVRRHLSTVKGGGLVRYFRSRQMCSLIISDVIGDSVIDIASGPTVEADFCPASALEVLKETDPYFINVPDEVVNFLKTAKPPKDPTVKQAFASKQISNVIIGNNPMAVEAARQKAEQLGYRCVVEAAGSLDRQPDAEDGGRQLADKLIEMQGSRVPVCFISGGEPTVRLCDRPGQGGRNQHLVLAALCHLLAGGQQDFSLADCCLLSGGSDGEDGNTTVAGAYIDPLTIENDCASDSLVEEFRFALAHHDSHRVFSKYGGLFRAENTKTNVCDLRVVLVRPSGELTAEAK